MAKAKAKAKAAAKRAVKTKPVQKERTTGYVVIFDGKPQVLVGLVRHGVLGYSHGVHSEFSTTRSAQAAIRRTVKSLNSPAEQFTISRGVA